ncbi:MAG: helix-turn-helix transcriptional regulator [Curvibacter sp.]|nr:helix-turn-helix transcriptional regulator [Curvibacter sp.]
MHDDEILRVQRDMRARLFEGPQAVRWRPGRELAAQLLLYLDDPLGCWRLTTDWLLELLGADRVDGGFGGFVASGGRTCDYVVMAEAQRAGAVLSSVLGLRFSATDAGLRTVWGQPGVMAIAEVSQARSLTEGVRNTLAAVGTAAKLALPVREGRRPVGMICADWGRETPRWNAEVCNQLQGLTQEVLGPVLATAGRLAADRQADVPATVDIDEGVLAPPASLAGLTAAELKVARLVARGLSYKEVARQLDRSPATVDHQLRSIRAKLGVRSTARLVHWLNDNVQPSAH